MKFYRGRTKSFSKVHRRDSSQRSSYSLVSRDPKPTVEQAGHSERKPQARPRPRRASAERVANNERVVAGFAVTGGHVWAAMY